MLILIGYLFVVLYKVKKQKKLEKLLGVKLKNYPVVKIKLKFNDNLGNRSYMKTTELSMLLTYMLTFLTFQLFFSDDYGSIIMPVLGLALFCILVDFFTIHSTLPKIEKVIVSEHKRMVNL